MAFTTGDNNYGTAKWIVDPTPGQGTHTTISAAISAASSGDTIFIRPATYTEDLSLKPGVNLTAYPCDAGTFFSGVSNVTVIGKATKSGGGTVNISGISLQTNSDFALVLSGSSADVVNLLYCFINCTNNTGISITNSNSSAGIFLDECDASAANTFTLWSVTGAAQLFFYDCQLRTTSTVASNTSSGIVSLQYCTSNFLMTTTSTGSLGILYCDIEIGGSSVIVSTAGTGTSDLSFTKLRNANSQIISAGSGTTINLHYVTFGTGASSTYGGAGTVRASFVTTNSTTESTWAMISPTATVAVNNSAIALSTTAAAGRPFLAITNTDSSSASSAAAVILASQTGGGDAYNFFNMGSSPTSWEVGAQRSTTKYVIQANPTNAASNMDGTTVASWTQSGIATFPLNPAFLVSLTTTANNVTGNGGVYTFGTQGGGATTTLFDLGSNITSPAGVVTFTCPTGGDGVYHFHARMQIAGVTGSTTDYELEISTTPRTFAAGNLSLGAAANPSGYNGGVGCTALVYLTAGQTAKVLLVATGMAGDTADILGSASTFQASYFHGHKVS